MEADGRKRSKIAYVLLYPLILINRGISFILEKAVGEGYGDKVTEEDIMTMVDAGNEEGVIEDTSAEIIENVLEYNDLHAYDVMTHRVNITAVDIDSSLDDIIYIALEKGFSRLPVYEKTIDKIIGVIIVKDLLCLIGDKHLDEFSLRDYLRETVYVPETCTCSDAFKLMTGAKSGMAVVIDEYGGTAGIVTLEDIIESVMGNIQDEYDSESAEIRKIGEDKYEVDGEADPDDVVELFGCSLPEGHEYDTVSGMVINLLGYLPDELDNSPHADYENIRFVITQVGDNCAEKLIVFRIKNE